MAGAASARPTHPGSPPAVVYSQAAQTFTISGRVWDAARNEPVDGLAVTLSGTKTAGVATGSDGSYSFTGLPSGGDYTVTVSARKPSLDPSGRFDWAFQNYVLSQPVSRSFPNLSADAVCDFAATLLVTTVGSNEAFPGLLAGDFDGDGRQDAAVSFRLGNGVQVLLGNGDGTFQPPKQVEVAESSDLLAAGDFDGDGKLDIALANRDSQQNPIVTVLYANGGATFESKTFPLPTPNTGSFTHSSTVLAAADFNGDGKPDLVEAGGTTDINGTRYSLNVLANKGGRDFNLLPAATLAAAPRRGSAADFNGDGKPDLVIINEVSTASVLLGNGDGTFAAPSNLSLGGNPQWHVAGDFNNDGKPDLLVYMGSSLFKMYLGNGDSTFHRPDGSVNFGDYGFPGGQLAAADFDGDGKLDLSNLATDVFPRVDTHFGRGDGAFSGGSQSTVGQEPVGLLTADFNGDGAPDMATVDLRAGKRSLSVLLNTVNEPAFTFDAPKYSLNERDGSIVITVRRTGDLTRPGSVRYATSEGTASERSDYTTALGTLEFAPGEASKSFTLFVTRDALAEGDETLTLGLGEPVGGRLGGPIGFTGR